MTGEWLWVEIDPEERKELETYLVPKKLLLSEVMGVMLRLCASHTPLMDSFAEGAEEERERVMEDLRELDEERRSLYTIGRLREEREEARRELDAPFGPGTGTLPEAPDSVRMDAEQNKDCEEKGDAIA